MAENCPMRHENGKCIPAGGFCTANKNICEALLNAYRMGKAQLSQEGATSDLISRQAVINAIENTNAKMSMPEWDEITNAVMSLPTIQPEPQWIPVSERLPEVGQTIIAQCRANIIKTLKLDSDGDWYQDAEHCYMSGFVIAWMPLPEAYKPNK